MVSVWSLERAIWKVDLELAVFNRLRSLLLKLLVQPLIVFENLGSRHAGPKEAVQRQG